MTIFEAILLGLVQGLTEFLPVSSSGHLVLGEHLLGLEGADNLTFEIFVHFGTMLSILTVYWKRVGGLIQHSLHMAAKPTRLAESFRDHEEVRTVVYILITMVPTGLAYVLFKDSIEAAFTNPRFAAGMLLVTGTLLLLTRLRKAPNGKLTPLKALLMGMAQSFAMLPGISRSGATICTALYTNVKPERAADFSFLMLLPIVLGATLLEIPDLMKEGVTMGLVPLLAGTVVAYLSGLLAIKVVIDFVRKGKLVYFAVYCYLVGTLGLLFIA